MRIDLLVGVLRLPGWALIVLGTTALGAGGGARAHRPEAGVALPLRWAAAGSARNQPTTGVQIIKGPYLQRVTPNSIVVMWETDQVIEGRVDYGLTQPGEASVGDPTKRTIHELEMPELASATTYRYTVNSGSAVSQEYVFTTAPNPGDAIRFVAFGDTRSSPTDFAAVVQAIEEQAPQPSLLLHVGDFVYHGRTYSEWGPQFFDPARDLIARVPMFPVLGNHEYLGTGTLWFKEFFSLPGNEEWYAFTCGCARFIGLNSSVAFGPASDQYQWLVGELASTEFTTTPWRFVFLHHPPFTSQERETDPIDTNIRNYLVPLFEQYGVTWVFSGHDHNYRHSVKSGIHYVVTGGGGAPLIPVGTPSTNATLLTAASCFEHCVVDLTPTSLSYRACRNDGTVLDALSLTVLADADHDGMPDVWEQANGLDPNDQSDAATDSDGDGFTNLQEFLAGTNPQDPAESLGITAMEQSGNDVQIRFRTVSGKTYRVEWSDSSPAGPWNPVGSQVAGNDSVQQVTDTGGANSAQRFYHVILVR